MPIVQMDDGRQLQLAEGASDPGRHCANPETSGFFRIHLRLRAARPDANELADTVQVHFLSERSRDHARRGHAAVGRLGAPPRHRSSTGCSTPA